MIFVIRQVLLIGLCIVASIGPCIAAGNTPATAINFTLLSEVPVEASLNDVCCGKFAERFGQEYIFKFETPISPSIFWLKIDNPPDAGVLDFRLFIDDVTLFIRDVNTGLTTRKSRAGDQNAADERELIATHNAFAISKSELEHEIYVRIAQERPIVVNPLFSSAQVFESRERSSMVVHGTIIGAASIMILFNFVLGILIRQMVYIIYCALVSVILLGNLYYTGIGPAFVWNATPNFSNGVFDAIWVFGIFFTGLFFYYFLKRPGTHTRLINLILLPSFMILPFGMSWLLFPAWISRLLLTSFTIVSVVAFLAIITTLVIRGYDRAKYLLPTSALVTFPMAMLVLIPKNASTFWTVNLFTIETIMPIDHVFEFTMILDILLFSLLVSYRIRLKEKEAENAYLEFALLQIDQNKKILETIDNERKRIASDLHDTAGQGLMAISTRLDVLVSKRNLPNAESDEVIKVANYSRGVVQDIRRISHDLHPAILDYLGWHKAVEELFNTLSEVKRIEVDLDLKLEENQLDELGEINLYRIVQEILSNIAKHTDATTVAARFDRVGDTARVMITDDGSSAIDATKITGSAISLGRIVIDQRMEILSGQWSTKRKNSETIVQLDFPLARNIGHISKGAP